MTESLAQRIAELAERMRKQWEYDRAKDARVRVKLEPAKRKAERPDAEYVWLEELK